MNITYVITIFSYSLWIKYKVSGIKNCEKLLEQHLNQLQKIPVNDMCFIELMVLERTSKQFVDGS